MNIAAAVILVGATGGIAALAAALYLLRDPPSRLMRTNFRGTQLPVVLGLALITGAVTALVSTWFFDAGIPDRMRVAALLIATALGIAGAWDDLRGDERPRGFSGHLGALRGGIVTGGIVKLVVGGVVGLIAGGLTSNWEIVPTMLTGSAVALGANLINLLDRAPGRAGKSALVMAVPLAVWGAAGFVVAGAAFLGPLLVLLWFDLKERAMLGDAGANPLGGMLGLGIVGFPRAGQIAAVALLLGLNLASERWSFGAAIDRNRFLRTLDLVGRRDPDPRA